MAQYDMFVILEIQIQIPSLRSTPSVDTLTKDTCELNMCVPVCVCLLLLVSEMHSDHDE